MNIFLLFLSACASETKDFLTNGEAVAQVKGYGPDCLETLEVSQTCNCDVKIEWSVLNTAKVTVDRVRAIAIAGGATDVMAAACEETLTQSRILQIWAYDNENDGSEDGSNSTSINLSEFDGNTLYVWTSAADQTIGSYLFADISSSSQNAVLSLE